MDEQKRRNHQTDVDTIMKASKLFARIPLPTQHTPSPPSEADEDHKEAENFSSQPTTNGALLHGHMYCFGKRAGYAQNVLFSDYIPIKGASRELYESFLEDLPEFARRLGMTFAEFADNAFLESQKLLNDLNAPAMASTSKTQRPGPHDFSSNFSFTLNNYVDRPHVTNDKGKVHRIWYPIDSLTGQITTRCKGFQLEGGWYLFPEYRIAFNFGSTAMAQIISNSKRTFHQTLPSKECDQVGPNGEKVHYTRLGCSSQITSSMARAAAKIGTKAQYVVQDSGDILSMEGREWKK